MAAAAGAPPRPREPRLLSASGAHAEASDWCCRERSEAVTSQAAGWAPPEAICRACRAELQPHGPGARAGDAVLRDSTPQRTTHLEDLETWGPYMNNLQLYGRGAPLPPSLRGGPL